MRTLQVITLGCSKNTVDTQHLLAQVRDDFQIVPEGMDAPVDYLLVNTCGFIGDAKEESVNTILECAGRKKAGRAGKLIVFGCLSQRYADSLPELIPEVDGWYGARDLGPVVRVLGVRPSPLRETERFIQGPPLPYAFLKISEGCDRRCSYCAIPLIRGAHRSVPIETVVKEAEGLVRGGVKELILIAQDTTYYGLDLYGRRALGDLLTCLSVIEGLHWIRIHYSYPQDFPDDVLDIMASNPKVCRYIDIPLQHISDKVLGMMHRHVDGATTRALVRKMRERVPGVALRTTMIVGHPGEGEEEFAELLDFVRETGFERLGAFTYSEEEGTFDAANFPDSVPEEVKKERLGILMEEQRGISLAYNLSRVGEIAEVLVDDYAGGTYVCRSEFESPEVDGEIHLEYDPSTMGPDPEVLRGKLVKVRITGADEYDLTAKLL